MIVKVQKRSRFTTIENTTLRDNNLSLAARGLLCFLLSHKHDWVVSLTDLMKHTGERRYTIRKLMKELRLAGYAQIKRCCISNGVFRGSDYVVTELPKTSAPVSLKSRTTGNSDDRQKQTVNTSIVPIEEERTNGRKTQPAAGFGLAGEHNGPTARLVTEFAQFSIENRLHLLQRGSTKHGWTKQTITRWCKELDDLVAEVGSIKRVSRVMRWYMDHWKDKFVPKAYTVSSFVDKYVKLRMSMKRDTAPEEQEETLERVWKDESTSPTGKAGWFHEYRRRRT